MVHILFTISAGNPYYGLGGYGGYGGLGGYGGFGGYGGLRGYGLPRHSARILRYEDLTP